MTQNRRSRRSNVLLTATLEVGGASVQVRLRNLSEEGALVEGDQLPVEGSSVLFERKELRVPSRVAWVQGHYAGIAFSTRLPAQDVLRHIPPPKTPRATDYRRPGLACRELSANERKMIERWMTAPSPQNKVGE